jgi:RHS repeat-associated protein
VDQNVIPEIVSDASAPSMHVAYNPANNRQTGDTADANGNLLPSGGGYQYDIFNRITSASGATYGYDAQNHRITRTDSSGNQFYALWGADGKKLCETNIYGTVTDSWAYFGGKTIMHGYGYVNADRLGSIGKFYPYGQERPSATANDTEKFTGYFRDSATGLDYAVQRYHQPGMGRFMTTDPAGKSIRAGDPGSWNRYAYVGGDPTNHTDASGLNEEDPPPTWLPPLLDTTNPESVAVKGRRVAKFGDGSDLTDEAVAAVENLSGKCATAASQVANVSGVALRDAASNLNFIDGSSFDASTATVDSVVHNGNTTSLHQAVILYGQTPGLALLTNTNPDPNVTPGAQPSDYSGDLVVGNSFFTASLTNQLGQLLAEVVRYDSGQQSDVTIAQELGFSPANLDQATKDINQWAASCER